MSPGFRLELLAGVGPEVAELKVQQQLHILRFGAFGQCQRGCQIVIAAAVRTSGGIAGVNPQTQPDIINAILFQQRDRVYAHMVFVIKYTALTLHFQQGRNIRALDKIGRGIAQWFYHDRLRRHQRHGAQRQGNSQ